MNTNVLISRINTELSRAFYDHRGLYFLDLAVVVITISTAIMIWCLSLIHNRIGIKKTVPEMW